MSRVRLPLRQVRPFSVTLDVVEEQRGLPPAMDQELPDMEPLESFEGQRALPDEDTVPADRMFNTFIDGVQRTVLAAMLQTAKGISVPLYVSRIGAGVLFRRERQVVMGPYRFWNVLVAPFSVLGEDPEAIRDALREQGHTAYREQEAVEAPPRLLEATFGGTGWLVADTSRTGLHGTGRLFTAWDNERQARSRAMGRIAHLRQILELAVLLGLRANSPEAPDWLRTAIFPVEEMPDAFPEPVVLVDGPLLFTVRRRKTIQQWIRRQGFRAPEAPERWLLTRAVGLVKSHRLAPKDRFTVLTLQAGHRTRAYDFAREVDLHGRALREDMEADDEDVYPGRHVTCYIRLYRHPGSALDGLVRLDLVRWALDPTGKEKGSERRPLSPEEERTLDLWGASLYRERRPRLDPRQPYPLALLEKALHARLPSSALLARLVAFNGEP